MKFNLLKNNLKAYLNFLDRNKLYTAINVFGLSVSLMFVILIGNLAITELFKDTHLSREHKNRVYVLADNDSENFFDSNGTAASGIYVAQQLKEKFPQIEAACSVTAAYEFKIKDPATNDEFIGNITFADSSFFKIFNIKLYEGVRKDVLKHDDMVVISRSFAKKMFKEQSPIGKTIIINYFQTGKNREYLIEGVFEDLDNSIFKYTDFIATTREVGYISPNAISPRMNNWGIANAILLAKEGEDLCNYENEIFKHCTENYWVYQNLASDSKMKIKALPLKKIYFNNFWKVAFESGNLEQLIILIIAGIIILVFAILNYINLTVSQTAFRAKEMATRRLLGVTQGSVFWKSILESTLLTSVAFILGFCFALAAEPYFNTLIGSEISIFGKIRAHIVFGYIILIIVTAFISGLIPAVIMAKAQPISVVRGEFGFKSKNSYGKIIIVLQNCITIIFLCMVITVHSQINHLLSAPLNYNTKDVMSLMLMGNKINESNLIKLKDSLLKTPFIEEVGFGMGSPLEGGNNNTIILKEGNREISFSTFAGDNGFFNILGFKMKQENQLATKGWYFTEYACSQMGISEDEQHVKLELVEGNGTFEYNVAGVIEDFVIISVLRDKEAAMLYKVDSFFPYSDIRKQWKEIGYPIQYWEMLIKVNNVGRDQYETFNEVKNIITSITHDDSAEFLSYCSDRHQLKYKQEITTQKIISIFAIVAIIISSLGLLAMSTYYTQQNKKSIAVRKIFGATTGSVLKQTVAHFMLLVGVAFVLAVPVAYWIVERWLQGYSYRIGISPMIFILSGVFTAIIALGTIYWQSHRAASANPADTVRT